MNLNLDLHELAQLESLMARFPAIAREEMVRAQHFATMLLRGELALALPIGAGGRNAAGLASSVFTEVQTEGEQIIGLVASRSPYAPHVEFGTKPHWIGEEGIKALVEWARVKLKLSDEKAQKKAAFAVRGAIAKRGTRAQPVWRGTYEAQLGNVRRIFANAIGEIIRRGEAQGAT